MHKKSDAALSGLPSVFRSEYIGSLKRLTNHQDPTAFTRVMSRAQFYVERIDFTDLDAARQVMAAQNAFADPADDVKLVFPI